jgi:hypothetical protein
MHHHGIGRITRYAPQASDDTYKWYGAGMAHTVASTGHVLSYCYCQLLWITMDYRLSWIIMDYRGVY